MSTLDRRLHAYRADLADARLEGQVEADRFDYGTAARVSVAVADLHDSPSGPMAAQILYGHDVLVFDRQDGWAWVQQTSDRYVGYLREEVLDTAAATLTHMVRAPRSFLYPVPDLKAPHCGVLSLGSKLTVEGHETVCGTDYAILRSGEAIIARHLMALGDWQADPVAVAETLLHTPYLWGGNSGFGVDCSGLVQLAQMLCGATVLRDSDMQQASIGTQLDGRDELKRGDLVFWKGHVGIMADAENLLHANGHTMDVALENLDHAIARIGYLYGEPTAFRRP